MSANKAGQPTWKSEVPLEKGHLKNDSGVSLGIEKMVEPLTGGRKDPVNILEFSLGHTEWQESVRHVGRREVCLLLLEHKFCEDGACFCFLYGCFVTPARTRPLLANETLLRTCLAHVNTQYIC